MPVKTHVVLKGNKYYARYIHPITKKQVWRATKAKSHSEAIKKAALIEVEVNSGVYADPGKIAWNIFRERYEAVRFSGLSAKTRSRTITVLNQFERVLAARTGVPVDSNGYPTQPITIEIGKITHRDVESFQLAMRNKMRKVLEKVEGQKEKRVVYVPAPLSENTIATATRHLKVVFNWAYSNEYISRKVRFPDVARAINFSGAPMKGRPLTSEEFDRMLECATDDRWRFFMRGLWLSGLRLEESLDFWWDRQDKMHVYDGMLRIFGQDEKGKRERLMPVTPDFSEFLESVPEECRKGRVFQPYDFDKPDIHRVSKIISGFGREAGIVVNERGNKYASAHDFRRTFGERWAMIVEPYVLMQLMRHQDISTTMRYYAGRNAKKVMELLKEIISGRSLGRSEFLPNKPR